VGLLQTHRKRRRGPALGDKARKGGCGESDAMCVSTANDTQYLSKKQLWGEYFRDKIVRARARYDCGQRQGAP